MSLKGFLILLAIIIVGGLVIISLIGIAIQWAWNTLQSFLTANPVWCAIIVLWLFAIIIGIYKVVFEEERQ